MFKLSQTLNFCHLNVAAVHNSVGKRRIWILATESRGWDNSEFSLFLQSQFISILDIFRIQVQYRQHKLGIIQIKSYHKHKTEVDIRYKE